MYFDSRSIEIYKFEPFWHICTHEGARATPLEKGLICQSIVHVAIFTHLMVLAANVTDFHLNQLQHVHVVSLYFRVLLCISFLLLIQVYS